MWRFLRRLSWSRGKEGGICETAIGQYLEAVEVGWYEDAQALITYLKDIKLLCPALHVYGSEQ